MLLSKPEKRPATLLPFALVLLPALRDSSTALSSSLALSESSSSSLLESSSKLSLSDPLVFALFLFFCADCADCGAATALDCDDSTGRRAANPSLVSYVCRPDFKDVRLGKRGAAVGRLAAGVDFWRDGRGT